MVALRRIAFGVFFIIYVTVCPATILYALGYSIDPRGPRLVKTGLIYLVTTPPGAEVRLDGKATGRLTPALLANLRPGDHLVELSLEGHRTWSDEVPVEAEKAAVFERVLLSPEHRTVEKLLAGPFEGLYPSGNGDVLLLVPEKTGHKPLLYDLKKNRVFSAGPSELWSGVLGIDSVVTVKESPLLVIRARTPAGPSWLGLDLHGDEPLAADWTDLVGKGPAVIAWDNRNDDVLFVYREGTLFRVLVREREVREMPRKRIRGFGVEGKRLYVLGEDLDFTASDFRGVPKEVLFHDPALGEVLFGDKSFFRVYFPTESTAIFWGERGELVASRLPYRFAQEGIKGFEWDPTNGRLLVWQTDKLGVIDFARKSEAEKSFFERASKLTWIHRGIRGLEEAFWVHRGSHILLHGDGRVRLVDLETYGRPKIEDLVSVRPDAKCFWSEKEGKLAYLAENGDLEALEIVPKKKLLELPFPDKSKAKPKGEIPEL